MEYVVITIGVSDVSSDCA